MAGVHMVNDIFIDSYLFPRLCFYLFLDSNSDVPCVIIVQMM